MRNKKTAFIRLLTVMLTALSLLLTTACVNTGHQGGPVNGQSTGSGSGDEDNNTQAGTDSTDPGAGDDTGSGDAGSVDDGAAADTGEDPSNNDQGDQGGVSVNVGKPDTTGNIGLSGAGQLATPYTWIYSEIYYLNKYSEDWQTSLINSTYELLRLSDEAKEAYPELSKALDSTNEFLEEGQKELFRSDETYVNSLTQEDIDNSKEYGYNLAGYDMSIFLRRADGDVLSFVCCTDRKNAVEWVYHDYMGFSFDMHTGKRINLGDIVKDNEALLDRLTSKAIDAANQYDRGFNGYEAEYDPGEIKSLIKQSLDGGGVTWTLDPQGITFYFNSFNLVAKYLEVPILFSEDTEGKIFSGNYPEPDYWVTYIQPCTDFYFDEDGDGKLDCIYADGYELFDEEEGYRYNLYVRYNEKNLNSEIDMVDMEHFMLVHEPGNTSLYMSFYSFVYPYINIYELSENGAELVQSLSHSFAMPDISYDSTEAGSLSGRFTDPTNIYLEVRTDILATCESVVHFNLERDGSLTRLDPVLDFLPHYQWTLTTKLDFYHLAIVNEDGDDTGYVTDVEKGAKLTLLRTDTRSYVDARTENGEIVRIPIEKSDEGGYIVRNDETELRAYEVFEEAMFAQ